MSTGGIIGATGGIGAACARKLAQSADTIILVGRREDALTALAAEIDAGSTRLVLADIAAASGRRAVATAVNSPLAWVVLAHGMPLRRPLAELDDDEIIRAYETNLVGPTLLLRLLLDLDWAADASIVVIGSISADRALPKRSVYGATKAGLEHLARALAAELASRNIRVNVISPGVIATPFLGDDKSALDSWVEARVPQQRVGTADEVAELVKYVALEAPTYLTGARIVVDGGVETVA